MSINLRLRHPKGVSTVTVNPEAPITELQQIIFSNTEISPSHQELKTGYPPKPLTVEPQLPVSSLGLKNGDQLIVTASPTSKSTVTTSVANQASTAGRQTPNFSAPALQPRLDPRQEKPSDASVQTPDGTLVHRVVPDDNSCLFSSIGLIFEQDMNVVPRLRQVVVDAIRKDPDNYSDAFLGFGEGQYDNRQVPSLNFASANQNSEGTMRPRSWVYFRAILLYSGIHYDAVSLTPVPDAPLDFHTTIFPVSSEAIMQGATQMAAKLRAMKAYTNTATFDLKCERCGKGLKGEKEARQHAAETGHAEFGEY
ncbi:ubiquitin-specific protease otu1 [Tulasnella sp. 408]|nr:ubiquitin-specific protease otu1 [Tulasnella sp. 408]